jgi:hypothetical protein
MPSVSCCWRIFCWSIDRERRTRTFGRISAARGDVAREALPGSKNNTSLEIREIQSVGVDLTEEKRHAAAITRVVEFGQ